MPVSVELEIVGFCFCFLKRFPPMYGNEPIWNILFICDSHHTLSLSTPGGGPPIILRKPDSDLFVDFVTDVATPTPAGVGTNAQHLLNLADVDIHGSSSPPYCSLRTRRRPKRRADGVWMRVPGSVLDVTPPAAAGVNYWMQPLDPVTEQPIGAPICKGPKASEITLRFSINDFVKVLVTDSSGNVDRELPFRAAGASTLTFGFDNQCPPGTGGANEFVNLYEFAIDEAGGTEKKFNAGKSRRPCNTRMTEKARKEIETEMFNPQGNCDPVWSDPPPGGG